MAHQPNMGMRPWKRPKRKLMRITKGHCMRPRMTALAMDTVKQSIASAIDIRIREYIYATTALLNHS